MFHDYEVFKLKEAHITLLSNTCITWNRAETGAPEINPKRPYGNSYVIRDIAELMGIIKDDADYTDEECNILFHLHYETQYALSVILETKQFTPGIYIRKRFSGKWRLLNDKDDLKTLNTSDLSQEIENIIKSQNGHYKIGIIKELERLGLDGRKLMKLDYNDLTKILERRKIQCRLEEERKLDKMIEELLIP